MAASVAMGDAGSDAGITPIWVIPLTTQGQAGHLCLGRSPPSSLLPPPSSLLPGPERWNMPALSALPCSGRWARVAACGPKAGEGAVPRGRFSCHSPALLLPPGRCSEDFSFPLVVMLSVRCREEQGNDTKSCKHFCSTLWRCCSDPLSTGIHVHCDSISEVTTPVVSISRGRN